MRIPGIRGRRLDTVQRVEQELKLPVLAELPLPSVGEEALRSAYSQLYSEVARQIGQNNGQHRTLAVTSALPGEGRSSVAANIALAAAQRGWSVLAVDTDVRTSQLPVLLGAVQAEISAGLIDLLAQKAGSPSEVLRETPLDNIRLLPVGHSQGVEVGELFASSRLERFVRQIAPRLADLVIFDAPHVLSKEPGRPILTHVDGVLFVVRLGETESARARHALEILEKHQVTVTGVVCLGSGTFSSPDAVPLPEPRRSSMTFAPGLKKSSKDTETLGNTTSSEEELPPAEGAPPQGDHQDGMSMKVFGTQKIEDGRDPDPVKGGTGIGIEDLEAVLQGWRRRDTTSAEAVGEVPSIPVPLPPAQSVESNASMTAPAGVAFPLGGSFLSMATGSSQNLDEDGAVEKPVLTMVEATETESEEYVSMQSGESTFEPIVPMVSVEHAAQQEPEADPGTSVIPHFAVPVFAVPVMPIIDNPILAAPEPVVPVMPIAGIPIPTAHEPVPVAPPVVVAPPVPAMFVPVAAPVVSAPSVGLTPQRSGLDLQIDMFQTAPGEMTMRASTTNATAIGYPNISLEIAVVMNVMRGMRVITPSSTGGADQPRIVLESVATDAPDAVRMRLVVGSSQEPALDVVLKSGEAFSLVTGTGTEQPFVRIDSRLLPDGTTVLRATLTPTRGGQELVLELRRDPVNDGFTDARWRNRLSLMS